MCMISLVLLNQKTQLEFYVIVIIIFLCGIFNMIFIKNMNLILLIIAFSSFFVAQLLINECIDSKVLLNVYLLYALFMLFMIVYYKNSNIFVYVSNNYASVYLLAPLSIYYSKVEYNNEEIKIYPAIIFLAICAFTTSRMGLLVASFTLICLIIYKDRFSNNKIIRNLIFIIIITFLIITFSHIIFYIMPTLLYKYSNIYIVRRFIDFGLTSFSRNRIWSEYLELLNNKLYLILGAPTNQVYWAARFYGGNLHNSFLIVHSYFGIIGVTGLIVFLIRSYIFGIQQKRWIYIISLSAFCMRSFSDHVFGCNRITPVIIFFVLQPLIYRHNYIYSNKQVKLNDVGQTKI